jgi:ATP-dependent helicase/nuclease subunit B
MTQTWRATAAQRHASRKPAVFTIPSDAPFVDALARGILDDTAADPLALAAITVLLPTRRACRALREAFLRLSNGKPLLLPRLVPLNDLDDEEALFSSYGVAEEVLDIPPPVAALKRELMLARMILALPPELGEPLPEQALRLARELAKFLDQVQTEQLSFDNLKNLVPEAYARHWQETLRFMEILTAAWPAILREENALDPADHRNRVFAAQGEAWLKGAASGPIIAAGSTGSIPATAQLLKVIAHRTDGCVVLPGLDTALETEGWNAVDETHPQHGLKLLLGVVGIDRALVDAWPGMTLPAAARAKLLSEVMRPASVSHVWRHLPALDPAAAQGLARLDCATPREEAEAIGLIMREALEEKARTCALVTPDRDLAARVAAELKRWNIDIDDSAGTPLPQTPPGAFLRLTAAMVIEDFAPVPLLAACNHPYAAAGLDPVRFRDLTRLAEREILRGPRPPAGLDGLAQLPSASGDVATWLAKLKSCWSDFAQLMTQSSVPLSVLLTAHMEAAEAFAATGDTAGPLRLWASDDGESAAGFIAELAQHADTLPAIAPAAYPAILTALMESRVVRPRFGKHPRLHILGPLEARLQRFDVLILGGLNEGTWPASAPADPWMSRPMRKAFGLPLHERRIGQAAHDIVQALSGPGVVMTRALKVEGTPTVPSRWLMRLDQVVKATGLEHIFSEPSAYRAWAKALTQPTADESSARPVPPAPRPPVAARPRKLSVTQIEAWMRDPYGVYARHILKLRALDPLDMDVTAAEYGTLIHQSLDVFIRHHPKGDLPNDALDKLIAIGRTTFAEVAPRPGVMAFWWPRFERIAAWFVAYEQDRRAGLAQSFVEHTGEMTIKAPGGAFTVTAKADRIDRAKDGTFTIIDYKTGTPPRETEIVSGFAPQLPLEAAILAAGGFKDIPAGDIASLSFWHLHGRADGGDERRVKADAATLAAEARQGLAELVAKFDDPNTPYEARPNPEHAPAYSDYEHLARVKEWAASGDEGDA